MTVRRGAVLCNEKIVQEQLCRNNCANITTPQSATEVKLVFDPSFPFAQLTACSEQRHTLQLDDSTSCPSHASACWYYSPAVSWTFSYKSLTYLAPFTVSGMQPSVVNSPYPAVKIFSAMHITVNVSMVLASQYQVLGS